MGEFFLHSSWCRGAMSHRGLPASAPVVCMSPRPPPRGQPPLQVYYEGLSTSCLLQLERLFQDAQANTMLTVIVCANSLKNLVWNVISTTSFLTLSLCGLMFSCFADWLPSSMVHNQLNVLKFSHSEARTLLTAEGVLVSGSRAVHRWSPHRGNSHSNSYRRQTGINWGAS